MKQTIFLFALFMFVHCDQSSPAQKIPTVTTTTSNNDVLDSTNVADRHINDALSGFEKATLYKLMDTIFADFNGDGLMDTAIYQAKNGTSGIVIKHGRTNEEFRIGFGKPFAHITEFNWVDYWGLVEDKETTEATFTEDGEVLGSRKITLQNPSIAVGANEVGGGLITFMNGMYVWIHQTC